MNKNIKYLVEDYLSFNPNVLKNEEQPKQILSTDIINNILRDCPNTKEDLLKLIRQKINETENEVLDLSTIDPSNIDDFSYLFQRFLRGNKNIKTINFQGWDTSKVTNMNAMFMNCDFLTNLDLSMFNTSNVTNMASMFKGCERLETVDVSSFDTSSAVKMGRMFMNCGLISIDVSHFKIPNEADIKEMFKGNGYLQELKLFSMKGFYGSFNHMLAGVNRDLIKTIDEPAVHTYYMLITT